MPSATVNVVPRPSQQRGHADHGWLDSYHTFSFADYYDSSYNGFGSLRVINEDRVSPGRGFGRHPHRDFEIFSYVVRGHLKHDDSLGHSETIGRGAVQFTSAGRGIAHSEMNGSADELVHFLQIWVKPNVLGTSPEYHTATFSDEDKLRQFTAIVAPMDDTERGQAIGIHADVKVYATLLEHGVERQLTARPGYSLYVHVVSDTQGMHGLDKVTALEVGGEDDETTTLQSGDGAFVTFTSSKSSHNTLTFKGVNHRASAGSGSADTSTTATSDEGASTSQKLKPTEFLVFELRA